MARSLPLQNAPAPTAEATTLTGTVQVFDPAMCCPTGICGPGVDPALLSITRDLRWLEAKGVQVDRFGLAQSPEVFVAQGKVTGLMQAFGDKALPATLVNGEVLTYGKYPTRDELVTALTTASDGSAAPASCCTPGSGCC